MKIRFFSHSLIMAIICLSGCSILKPYNYNPKYPDRPSPMREGELVAQFRGLPVTDLAPYMTTPDRKTPSQWKWGETRYVHTENGDHLDVCTLAVDIDDHGIITNTTYIDDTWTDKAQCPQMVGVGQLQYIFQPDLYTYDKVHNILIPGRILPEQDTSGLAQKLARKKR